MEKKYAHLLRQYLTGEQEREKVLYALSLMSNRFIAAGYGPEDVVALHAEALSSLPEDIRPGAGEYESLAFLLEVMIAYGVRHREQIQFEMAESERQAEQRAAVALAEAEERLRQNRQRLQDRDDFVGFIAHELRHPLTTILGRATLGERYVEGNEKARTSFRAIYEATRQMGATLDLLLELSRKERDYSLTATSDIDIAALLHESLNILQSEQRAKELSIAVDIEPPRPIVQGDAAALRTVFSNLLSNAIKYNRQRGEVMIRTRHLHGWVQIEVVDNGIGISPEELPHIFNRYYRIKRASNREQGSGLGLALVEYIVHQHGGHIEAESEEGRGSCFRVQLPYHQATYDAQGGREGETKEIARNPG